ncbi:MAG: MBL fold metallo-hydrolase [Bradymonadaceae bacterium]
MPYVIEELADDLFRIELSKSKGLADPIGRPNNVYLIRSRYPALIGAGHPTQFQKLSDALRELGVSPSELERVIHTSWDVDVLAGASNFADVDHFVLSPNMVEPLDYESLVDAIRRDILEVADALVASMPDAEFDSERIKRVLRAYYPPAPRHLKFIPIRGGHILRASSLELEVLATDGPGPGHCCLYEPRRKWLFSGDFALMGLPEMLTEAQAYLISLERLVTLDVGLLLPTHGAPDNQGRWTLARAFRFFNNFLSSVPTALVRAPTILEFIEQDLGHRPEDLVELVFACRRYRVLFEELVRLRAIAAEGSGLERRYGTDVDDPRKGLRR